MTAFEEWRYEAIGASACEALKASGFDARFVPRGTDALELIAEYVKPGMKVGFGGSMTLREIGALDRVRAMGAEVLDHSAPGLDQEAKLEVLRAQLTCDLFLSSSNAVTLEGDLVNVDGNGNRIAALSFGPRKTLVVVGANKIVRDLDEALGRIETYAAPLNNKRLSRPNPCVKSGTCEDCRFETRICRAYHILRRKPTLSDFTVVIVGESLGF